MAYKCPHCEANPLGGRWRDGQGNVWHLERGGVNLPCYERNRGTDYEKSEELRNELQADRYAGRAD